MFNLSRCSVVVLVIILMLVTTAGCGPSYLSEPPSEFYDYVNSLPFPRASTQLADKLNTRPAPREICTNFNYIRLYGTNEDYVIVQTWYERDLANGERQYVRMPGEHIVTTFVLGEFAVVSIAKVSVSEAAFLGFDQEMVTNWQASFETLFILAAEHDYGDCKPHPNWPK